MHLNAYEIAVIGVFGTIIGALLGAWIGYRLSMSLAKDAERRRAFVKLVKEFRD